MNKITFLAPTDIVISKCTILTDESEEDVLRNIKENGVAHYGNVNIEYITDNFIEINSKQELIDFNYEENVELEEPINEDRYINEAIRILDMLKNNISIEMRIGNIKEIYKLKDDKYLFVNNYKNNILSYNESIDYIKDQLINNN